MTHNTVKAICFDMGESKPRVVGCYDFKVTNFYEVDFARIIRESEPGTDAILVSAGDYHIRGLVTDDLAEKLPHGMVWLSVEKAPGWRMIKLYAAESTAWYNAVLKARAVLDMNKAIGNPPFASTPKVEKFTVRVKKV